MVDDEPGHSSTSAGTRHIALSAIERDRNQARQHFDEPALDELADSIARIGLLQPIVVRSTNRQTYRLIAGERRWRAAQRAGLTGLPAIVRDDLDDAEASSFGLVENLQRESLSVMETARGLARLADDFGLTHDLIARRIGKSREFVTNFLRLTQLVSDVQHWVDAGQLSLGHAKILAGLTRARQIELGRCAIGHAWSVRRLETAARESNAPNDNQHADTTEHELAKLARGLSAELGNDANISYQAETGRGELRIRFNSLEEFDGLLARLGYQAN
ncbi:ParB/RepB/Spo0J family partition protein [Salinisphaera sp. USBA-960]|uniref:ParB/RepB/Spo0J family partition protein n=1 Tax=Salinisphaera orenii TaxID=856731 RepID=UPI000DBE1B7D|nr:ParB/RepB/Spo0J family partition protein [Salifodinibacter halophilus]NNC27244.1 ParB/RepB/Spo0J family partition protein [Salifodinibacter halophilus]